MVFDSRGIAKPPRPTHPPQERQRLQPNSLIEEMGRVHEQISLERRESHNVRTQALHFLADGRVDFGQGPVFFEKKGLQALARQNKEALPRAGALLLALEPELRSVLLSEQLRSFERELVFRTRVGPTGQRQVFAVVSRGYRVLDASELIDRAYGDVESLGLSGGVIYDARTTDFELRVLWSREDPTHARLGDVFNWGVLLRTNDAGAGAIRARAIIERLKCLNLCEFYTESRDLGRQSHLGDLGGVLRGEASLGSLSRGLEDLSDRFVEQWGILREHGWRTELGPTIGEAYAELIRMAPKYLGPHALRRKHENVVRLLVEGWEQEEGETLADLINGITAVHTLSAPESIRVKLEVAAGMLMSLLVDRL